MKKILLAIPVIGLLLGACTDIDELSTKVDDLESRVSSLEAMCEDMNSNIKLLQKVASAQEGCVFIEKIENVSEGVKITFTDGSVYALRNGEKGAKGDKGIQGEKGDTGASPIVSIGVDGGVSYWKVNDEWILVDGKKVSAIGVTPQMKIEGKKWMISYDAGATWNEVAPAYDESTAITISETEDEVTFSLHDGTKYVIAKTPGFKFKVSEVESIAIAAGATKDIPYTIAKGDGTVRFIVQGKNYSAVVVPTDATKGVVKVTAPDPIVAGWVLVTAVQNSTGESKAQYLEFGHGDVAVVLDAEQVETLGGIATVAVKSNIHYSVSIPAEAQDWISLVPQTKAYTVDTLRFSVQPNYTCAVRQATITLTPDEGEATSFVISQAGETVSPEFPAPSISATEKGYGADTVKVTVAGTVLWTIELSEGLTATKMAGAGPAEVIVNIPANSLTTVNPRTITVKTDNASVATKSYTLTVNQAGAPDQNDYYAQYMAGMDISIAGMTINKTTNPTSTLTKVYEWENNNYLTYAKNGVVFLDYDAADGKEDTFTPPFNVKPENVIIIGRYRNHQPVLTFGGSNTTYPTKDFVAFKNIKFVTSNYGISTGNSTAPVSVYMEDCTLVSNADFVFCQANATLVNNFKDIYVKNCVLSSKKAVIGHLSGVPAGSNLTSLENISFTNTVMCAPANTTGQTCFGFRTNGTAGYYDTPNANFNIDHCTFYNYNSNGYGLIGINTAKSIYFTNNVVSTDLTKGCMVVYLPKIMDPAISGDIKGNYLYSTNANAWVIEFSSKYITNSGITSSGNACVKSDTPIAAGADVSKLYVPVDETKVTNGAGASYDTKLWQSWK